jgi:hypothetical protein
MKDAIALDEADDEEPTGTEANVEFVEEIEF